MSVVQAAPTRQNWLSRLLTTDFCPWANRFVYWLKEPVGWFALATVINVIIGIYLAPVGWTLAAALTAIMIAGVVWPWVAVRVTHCQLFPESSAVHEESECRTVLAVRNYLPIPVWGLAIEGYLDCQSADDSKPTVGLASVPPLCTAEYFFNLQPKLRGHYPAVKPQVACSFPFGIWTARRELVEVKPLTVWPKVYRLLGVAPLVGQSRADQGEGNRPGGSGDFIGVRSFRRGDAAKHVNWIASARSESLIVNERGGPEAVEVHVWIDTRVLSSSNVSFNNLADGVASPCEKKMTRLEILSTTNSHKPLQTDSDFISNSLTRRMRVAASVLVSLHQSRIESKIRIGDENLKYGLDASGRRSLLNALANVPPNGVRCEPFVASRSRVCLLITGDATGAVVLKVVSPQHGRSTRGSDREILINDSDDLAVALATLWKEVRDGRKVA